MAFYNLAALFVYPSFYESFGIPLVEAMACGCPIVASHTGAIPEIAGNAACLVDPRDAKSIADGMHRVLKDGDFRRDMISKGLRRAKSSSLTLLAPNGYSRSPDGQHDRERRLNSV